MLGKQISTFPHYLLFETFSFVILRESFEIMGRIINIISREVGVGKATKYINGRTQIRFTKTWHIYQIIFAISNYLQMISSYNHILVMHHTMKIIL